MSYTIEDVYDIVLKWGNHYPEEILNLMFVDKFIHEGGKIFMKRLLVNSDKSITNKTYRLLNSFMNNKEWRKLNDLLITLQKYNANLKNITFRCYDVLINTDHHVKLSNILKNYLETVNSNLEMYILRERTKMAHYDEGDKFDLDILTNFINFSLYVGETDEYLTNILTSFIDRFYDSLQRLKKYIVYPIFGIDIREKQLDILTTAGKKCLVRFNYNLVMHELMQRK